jgi:3-oxoadipate enol-lactonase
MRAPFRGIRSDEASEPNGNGTFATNWTEVNGTSLRYDLSGSGPTTLVLVHEIGGTLDGWDQVLPALNNGRRVLRYDTRGAGLSEKIKGAVTWDQMAGDLAARLDALGITGKVSLAGKKRGQGAAYRRPYRRS